MSLVLVTCFRVPFERFKTHKSPEAITASRSPSPVAATSVSMPSMSMRRVRRGTSNVLWPERVALNKYQTVVRRVAAMTKGTIGNRMRSRACYYTRSLNDCGSSRLRFFLFLATVESGSVDYNTRLAVRYTGKIAIRPAFLFQFCMQLFVILLRIGQAPVSKGRNLIKNNNVGV